MSIKEKQIVEAAKQITNKIELELFINLLSEELANLVKKYVKVK